MKNCWQCTEIRHDTGWTGTEDTPGDAASFSCAKGHWELSAETAGVGGMYADRTPKFRETFEKAETCPDFTPVRP
jgi:hypothetical protein